MNYNSLIIGLSALALQSCTDDLIDTEPDNEATLTGNTYKAASTESSSADRTFTLESGSQILLNASGSLQINNKVLTYVDSQWKAENGFDWADMVGKTNITALYPVYSNLSYTKENLYKNDLLEDILYVKDEFPAGYNISLHFKHLFSLLTLHLSEDLQNGFQKIEVTCPVVVSAIEPESVQMTLADNEGHITSTITQTSSSGNYSFIIPPAENVAITIDIQTAGKKYTTQLPSKSFTGNQEYTYNLKTSEKNPGIVTAEDWIAFSQLINNRKITEYKGKTLNDFGKMTDGVMTYRLLNDIDFEGVVCTDLEQIKDRDSRFKDIFDGQGHTISNLTPKTKNGTTGLFGAIDTEGIIKNLHLKSCNATITKKGGTGSGILAGACYGTLSNCSLEKSSINSQVSTDTGGLLGTLRGGTIINCHVQNSKILSNSSTVGGITGISYGTILNCFSANNTIKSNSNYIGGISGKSITDITTIANCYVYSNALPSNNRSGLFFGAAKKSKITHCFYFSQASLIGKTDSSDNTISDNSYFTDENKNQICPLLNQWIEDNAGISYPNLTFTSWESSNDFPAIFCYPSSM